MQHDSITTVRIDSIAECHQLMGLDKPKHPLFSILPFENIAQKTIDKRTRLITEFYEIVLKRDCPGKLQYGQTMYDFDEGVMSFFGPRQVSILEPGEVLARSGWILTIHQDFLRAHPFAAKMKDYGFFGYAVNEALILSQEEEDSIENIFQQIEKEYNLPIDNFSRDVVIANIDLLLTYCNRYYNRQFILRKPSSNTLLEKFDHLLNTHFNSDTHNKTLPTVSWYADQLNISANYLSDMLRQLTGQNARQLIHGKMIDKAKEYLTTTELSVSEIAYILGFEYPQSFSKLFKAKTDKTPMEFRDGFR